MPFTLSHPAFAVPLRRLLPGELALPGLVLGSMAPDLEYFARMEAVGTIGHRYAGFLLLGLPLGIALCCAYLFVIRPALPGFMPSIGRLREYVQAHARYRKPLAPLDWLFFVLAAHAGYATHIFVDAWTHRSGWFVRHIAPLRQPVMGDYWFQWLQYLTSLIGAALIGAWLLVNWLRWRGGDEAHRQPRSGSGLDYGYIGLWLGATAVGLLVLLVKLNGDWLSPRLAVWTVAPFSAAAVGIYAVSILVMTGRVRQWGFGLSVVVLLLAVLWAFKLGILPFAAAKLGMKLLPVERWIGTIWTFSAAILFISIHTNRIVKEFVRIGLKTVNNRTLL